jgi:hypothetical protein
MVFSTSNFFPDDYDVEVNDEGWGKLMIENSILTKNDKSSHVIIWDVSTLTINEEFWGDRGFLIDDFKPANCIEWTFEGYDNSLSCIYHDYEVYIKNHYSSFPYPLMKIILNNIEFSKTGKFMDVEYTSSDNMTKNDSSILLSNLVNKIPESVEETVVVTQETSEEEGGGCLIATAAYRSELAPQVQQLRELRDNQLLQTQSGTVFMGTFNDIYYSFSPIIADYERESPIFKEIVKAGLTPMLSTLAIMESAETESEVLGLGLSVIALNLGMYIGLPAFGIVKLTKFF